METAYGEISDLAGDIQVKIGGRLDRVDWTYSTATSCFMASGLSPWQRHLMTPHLCFELHCWTSLTQDFHRHNYTVAMFV